MTSSSTAGVGAPIHMIDLILKKRDGGALDERELEFIARGATRGEIPLEQLAAWLMAAWIRGLNRDEARALTIAMRDSGVKFDPSRLGKRTVDKHSTGGVGDKTSFLIAPLAAACGVAVPMISGRALGHTGGTLDKLESIPGLRTALTLVEFEAVIQKVGAAIVSQTPALVPADRVLYALRDRTGTVECPGLICASILSKKLSAGLDALVLDVKTGSGAFMSRAEDAEFLAELMVATAEAAGTRTVALMTDMSRPLGVAAGNWIEIEESLRLLRGERPAEVEDLRELSLLLAGWMVHVAGAATSAEEGYAAAEKALMDGRALKIFEGMIAAQGGDISIFKAPERFHKPGATRVLEAWDSGYVAAMDTTALGWAVQRTGAGREKAGEPVDAHAGILFHKRYGARVEKGERFATLFATTEAMLDEPEQLIKRAVQFGAEKPPAVPLVSKVITAAGARQQ